MPDAPEHTRATGEPSGRRRMVADRGTGPVVAPGPLATVAELVEAQVARTPDAIATICESERQSYTELDRRANRLAHHLRRLGVGPDVPVGICLRRSTELVVGLLAILKAGGAYLPLDPDYPTERLRVMVDEARPRVLVSQSDLADRLSSCGGTVLLLDADAPAIASEPSSTPASPAGGDDLAYVIFTSGSSGRPKGVAMPHRALCNLLEWQRGETVGRASRRTLQFASVSFDVAFQEIFGTLVTGGELVLIGEDLRRDFDRVAAFVDRERIERLFLPPLALEALAQRLSHAPSDSDVEVFAAGERLEVTPSMVALWRARPNWQLHNHYGPTESHVVTAHTLGGRPESWPGAPPIGRPIANTRIYLLDTEGAAVPIGVPGELHIGGVCLARGYVNQPRLTAERFVEDPFEPGSRMYRTGDAACWREDGAIEYLGRLDDQVKVRGFRIEPGEIVGVLVRHAAVRQAAVIAEDHSHQGRRLVAYVVPAGDRPPASRELREHLERSLPDYMVPAAFVTLAQLPLTPNGKLDHRALPAADEPVDVDELVPTRSSVEEGVAAIWAEALGLELVGAEDNFFALGGHSLLAGQVVSNCAKAFGVPLSLRTIFAGPTVREMGRAIESMLRDGVSERPIPRAERRRLHELLDDV